MAHEISTVEINGQNIVEAVYANKPAWHGLGEVYAADGTDAPDSETAIEKGHLGWEVEKQSLYLGDGSKADGCYATVRKDTGTVLGAVGERYQLLQNREAFAFMDSLHQDGIIRYESAFALRGGRQVVLLARLPSVDSFAENDFGLRYIMLRTSHDGSTEIDLVPTSVRVVCMNTVRAAMSQSVRHRIQIRHSGDMREKLDQARSYLSLFDKQFTLYSEAAQRLAECNYTADQAKEYIDTLFPVDDKATTRVQNNQKVRVQAVREAFRHSSNRLPAMEGKFWQLFNSVTFALDHSEVFNRQRGDDRARKESRFLSTWDGEHADLKSRALNVAMSMAGVA